MGQARRNLAAKSGGEVSHHLIKRGMRLRAVE
jgi:hypothetical protein